MVKTWCVKAALVVVSVVAALCVAEIGYRIVLFSDSPVFDGFRQARHYADYFSDDDYWKLRRRFGVVWNPSPEAVHPLLGWMGAFSRDSYLHHDAGEIGERRPVLLYGDSFAQCVWGVLCFEDILNNDSDFSRDHYLLNYGVGGYGTDQILLLMQNSYTCMKIRSWCSAS